MRPGLLQHRIKFQQRSITKNPSNGEDVVVWVDVATVWAQFDPVRGREFFASRQNFTEQVAWFRIRYRVGLTTEMRILFKSKHYDIDSLVNVRGLNLELEIFAKEGLTDG
jgi:SPP1 family predicted phage head-tail adaptor